MGVSVLGCFVEDVLLLAALPERTPGKAAIRRKSPQTQSVLP
jgi:hypothetical protein